MFKIFITKTLKDIFKFLGFNILRYNKNIESRKYNWLKELEINSIIDIGANVGVFSIQMHQLFPKAKIYAFEPLRDCYFTLKKNVGKIESIKTFNIALGERKERKNIIVNSFNPSSSILKMSNKLKDVFQFLNEESNELIEIDTLDFIMNKYELANNLLIKIDVQGYEKYVLAGSSATLEKTMVIIIELSFEELYIGSPLFEDIYMTLYEKGFRYRGIWDQVNSPLDGKPIYQDAVFLRM